MTGDQQIDRANASNCRQSCSTRWNCSSLAASGREWRGHDAGQGALGEGGTPKTRAAAPWPSVVGGSDALLHGMIVSGAGRFWSWSSKRVA